jgi:hypothetical protein
MKSVFNAADTERHQRRRELRTLVLAADKVELIRKSTGAMTIADRICVSRDGLIMQVADPLTFLGFIILLLRKRQTFLPARSFASLADISLRSLASG